MWDNRGTADKPKANPKAPDWKCKAQGCDGVIWPPKGADAAPAATEAALALYDPMLADYAAKLKALLPNGSKLSMNEALAGAQYAKATGLDPYRGEFYIVPGIGVTPGYKGVYVRQGQQGREPLYTYRRELTPAEREWNDIEPGDKAVICEATDPAEAAQARKEGREPRVWQGIGIVRAHEQFASTIFENGKKRILPRDKWGERLDPPVGRSWGWKAENRAMKDCANHMGIPAELDAETILNQAAAAGIKIETLPDEARLSAERAQAAVAQAFNAAARAADPRPPVITARAPADFQGFDDGPIPPGLRVTYAGAPADPAWPQSHDAGDWEEGEFAVADDPNDVAAPLTPADLIILRLREVALPNPNPPDEPQLRAARAAVGHLVGGSAVLRKHALAVIFERASSNDLTTGECAALAAWIGMQKVADVWLPLQSAIDGWRVILDEYPAAAEAEAAAGK
jgi:hypothetical protein